MDINTEFWNGIKSRIKGSSESNKLLATWLDPIEYVDSSEDNGKLRFFLSVPNSLHKYWVSNNLHKQISDEISTSYKNPFEIEYVISSGNKAAIGLDAQPSLQEALNQSEIQQNQVAQPHVKPKEIQKTNTSDPLKPEWTFQTFVVGKNSEFAHAATYNVAQNPGAGDYNPLLIYGPVGMGKSHLLHAAGNKIREVFPNYKVLYISAERFMNECIASIRHNKMEAFRQKYRENFDILLVDDIQLLGKGESSREEFFHTLNAFIDLRKQVILASDRMPKDIIGLEDRNRTRLERGLIADITMPDLETRIAILRYKAEQLGMRLPDEVIHYIGRISKRSIRELEGNLKKIKMFSEFQGLQIDYDLAKRVLVNHETQTSISIEEVMKIVADHFDIKLSDLKSSLRAKPIVVPRQIAMYLIKKFMDKSFVDIGKAFGGKDHTTVMNAIERVQLLQVQDQDIFNNVKELESKIHNITGL